jgi:hypothetical protein
MRGCVSGLHQIPQIAVEVLEHGDLAVGLLGRRADEADALGGEVGIVAPEIVGLQEQKTRPPAWLPMKAACSGVAARARDWGGQVCRCCSPRVRSCTSGELT